MPPALAPALAELGARGEGAAQAAVAAHYERWDAGPDAAEEVLAWLQAEAPSVLLVDGQGRLLWDPERPEELGRLRPLLAGITAGPAAALRADLGRAAERSAGFLAALEDPEALPRPSEAIDQGGGLYLHAARRLLAFDLERQPSWVPLREPTPPFQRLLLAARAAHEWGHLAEEAGWVRVAPECAPAAAAGRSALVRAFSGLLREAPAPLRAWAEAHLPERLGVGPNAGPEELGAALAESALRRLPDYAANYLMARLLPPAELEAYLRVNVRTHVEEGLDPFLLLARYAVEAHYLGLGACAAPLETFLRHTAADRLLAGGGLLSREALLELLEAAASVCAAYALREEAFRPELLR
ncbi:MAG: hypothetical protein D6731_08100 [Planctomycetota bacterium]|nr:MAG: hypothetical protein D6731_08100 [Planctomycetota bacterium]